jgi:hypothetical protein
VIVIVIAAEFREYQVRGVPRVAPESVSCFADSVQKSPAMQDRTSNGHQVHVRGRGGSGTLASMNADASGACRGAARSGPQRYISIFPGLDRSSPGGISKVAINRGTEY